MGVLLAYLFGSLNRGQKRYDVNLAILTEGGPAFHLRQTIVEILIRNPPFQPSEGEGYTAPLKGWIDFGIRAYMNTHSHQQRPSKKYLTKGAQYIYMEREDPPCIQFPEGPDILIL
jgi:hypothetical protein